MFTSSSITTKIVNECKKLRISFCFWATYLGSKKPTSGKSGRYVDINRGQFTDSTYTTRGRIYSRGRFLRTEVGCPETKTDPKLT